MVGFFIGEDLGVPKGSVSSGVALLLRTAKGVRVS